MCATPDLTPRPASGDEVLPSVALALLQASGLIVGVFDTDDILRFANPAFVAAYHLRPDGHGTWVDLMRGNYQNARGTIVETQDFEAWLASARSRRGKQAFRGFESSMHDGRWIWMTETTLDNGWMLCVASDISSLHEDGRTLRQARDQALRAAQTDPLTGISNRMHMTQQLDQLLAQGQPFALVLLDLDHFKRINDRHGHPAGDEVIRDFARHLQASTRRGDGCGRVGGEEFMLLLPGVDTAQSQAIVQRLLQTVRATRPLPQVAPALRYSASAGLALRRPQEDAARLYHRADCALYRAKEAGRDRLVCDDGAAEPPQIRG